MKERLRAAVAYFRGEGLNEIQVGMLLRRANIDTPSPQEAPAFNQLLDALASEGEICDLSSANKGWGYAEDAKGFPSYSVGARVGIL